MTQFLSIHELMERGSVGHLAVVCLDTKPLSGSEARGDLVVIQTLCSVLLMLTSFGLFIMSRLPQTSLSYRGLVTCHKTVKYLETLIVKSY